MAEEIRLPPALAETFKWIKQKPCEWLSIREVADGMGISYYAARYRLYGLYRRGLIERHVTWMRTYVRGRWVRYRRIWFHYIPVIPKPIVAVVDSRTGYLITYFEEEYEGSQVWLYDEERKTVIEAVEAIRLEKTFSVDTEGHESLLAEVTAYTIIKAEDMNHEHTIKDITDELERKAVSWFLEKFTNVTKEGIPIVPKFTITEDFTIQEREEEALYEMSIIQWFMTVAGEWEEKPRILKAGFGAYTTTEKPIWRTARIYVEYAHELEPRAAHRIPPEEFEEIDP